MDGQILVPFAIESALSGVGRSIEEDEVLWYERKFSVPKDWNGSRIMLNFGAVDWKAEVYVNGQKAGEHTGGYTPFSFDITDLLARRGRNTLRVKVSDRTDNWFQARGKQVSEPGGIWYTSVTGIWQTVWMEPVPESHVRSYHAQADIDASVVTISVDAVLSEDDACEVVLLENGNVINKGRGKEVTLDVPQMRLWTPDSPQLYDIEVNIVRDGIIIDHVDGYAAMREISCKTDADGHKRMCLNGEPLFQYGPLDQGWWPDGLYTAPTDEALEFDVIKTKEHGFNMIRKHIKVEPARWYYYCDLHGIMVWQDMPCIGDHSKTVMPARDEDVKKAVSNKWSSDSIFGGTECDIPQEWKDNYYREWANILNAFKNFQCIVVWVPFNEAWGQFDTPAVVKFTREIDPTRLINPASGGNFDFSAGVKEFGDILDVHHYPCPAMNVFERKFVNVLGEYGGIGMPVEGHTWIIDRKWGYGKVKENSEELMKQYEEYLEMLKTFVATGCAAAVYTQTTDVEGEVNGLMTYDRKVIKMDVPRIAAANRKVIESMSK